MYNLLYVKSNYSLLSSLLSIDDIINYSLENKLSYAVLCDDNMYGTMEFLEKCQSNNLKPVIGLEVLVKDYKILLFVKNYQGYLNLIKICTKKNDNSLTVDDILKYQDHLFCLVPFTSLDFYLKFKDRINDIYLGFSNKVEEDKCLSICSSIVYLKLCLYKNKSDSEYLKYLYLIRDSKTLSDDFSYDVLDKELNCSSVNSFSSDKGLLNTLFIVDNCNLVMPNYEALIPLYETPNGVDSNLYLSSLATAGLKKRLNNNISKNYLDRLYYELDIINKMGFSNYFLIVYDFIKYAKKKNILLGPGRGSAASSLVSYSLGITEIDPLKYDLLFERFLNPARGTMPDIDTDIPDIYREEIISYVINKYGAKKVAGIVTFSTLTSKQVLKDVSRIFNVPIYKSDKLTSFITSSHESLQNIYKTNFKFKEYVLSDKVITRVFKTACMLEGAKRQIGTHAAGVVICQKNLDEVIPLTKNGNMYLTGYSMNYLEKLGLLKMDFLGIRNLTVIMNILDTIYKVRNIKIDFNNIPLDDSSVYDLIKSGNTSGIFQFESSGMRNFLKKLKPTNFNDLIASIALFRPGPMKYIDLYISRKEKLMDVIYSDESIADVLKDTYGIMIYQEQIMQVARIYAGYSLADADILRRAISKKNAVILKNEESKFIQKATALHRSPLKAKEIFNDIMKFANYGFNKAHAVAYSMVAYKMAYLKAHYKLEFYTCYLNNLAFAGDKMHEIIREIRSYGIIINKPDINQSYSEFMVLDNAIMAPFPMIKGINIHVSDLIIKARDEKFNNIYDAFVKLIKVGLSKKHLESLIIADSFRCFGYNKKTLITNLDSLYNYGTLAVDLSDDILLKPELIIADEYKMDILLEQEIDCFGFYISNHPTTVYKSKYNSIVNLNSLSNYFNKEVCVIVMLEKVKTIKTKNNEDMAFVTASDETASFEFVFFPKVYKLNNQMKKGDICIIKGVVERRYDMLQIIVNKINYIRE